MAFERVSAEGLLQEEGAQLLQRPLLAKLGIDTHTRLQTGKHMCTGSQLLQARSDTSLLAIIIEDTLDRTPAEDW